MKNHLVFFALLFFSYSQAQEKYRVAVDYNSGNLIYLKLDKHSQVVDTLDSPKFKKNSIIEVKINNVNPFALNVETKVNEEFFHESSQGFNISSLLGKFSAVTQSDMNLDITGLMGKVKGTTRGDKDVIAETNNINQILTDFNDVSFHIETIKTTLIENLKNPNLKKEQIMGNLFDLVETLEDPRIPNPKENFYNVLTTFEKIIKTNRNSVDNFLILSGENLEQSKASEGITRGDLLQSQATFLNIQKTQSNLENSTQQTVENLKTIQKLYSLLDATSFEHSFDYVLNADKVLMEFQFKTNSNDQETNENNAVVKTKDIQIVSKGGFKINTSIALTLNNFGKNSNEYYLNDENIIGADLNDFFVPNLSTMINFYPMMSSTINVGGSFGISVPIFDSSNGIKGINFLLGPSLILGNKNRVSLSGGIVYGPVDKLKNGLEVGQYIDTNEIDNYVKTVYDIGYYVGFSFSLMDLK